MKYIAYFKNKQTEIERAYLGIFSSDEKRQRWIEKRNRLNHTSNTDIYELVQLEVADDNENWRLYPAT
jgi:ABC-type xylose transport system substrate-binding protein